MNEKSLRFALKHLCYAVSMLVLFTLQTTPGLFELWGVKPILVVPFAVCIAALEGEFIGGLYGALAGLLCDLAGSWVFGFHAILCLCCHVAVGLAAIYLVRRSLGSGTPCLPSLILCWPPCRFIITPPGWRQNSPSRTDPPAGERRTP